MSASSPVPRDEERRRADSSQSKFSAALELLVELRRAHVRDMIPPEVASVDLHRVAAFNLAATSFSMTVFASHHNSFWDENVPLESLETFQRDVDEFLDSQLRCAEGEASHDSNAVDVFDEFLCTLVTPAFTSCVLSRECFTHHKQNWVSWADQALLKLQQGRNSEDAEGFLMVFRLINAAAENDVAKIIAACRDLFVFCANVDCESIALLWVSKSYAEVYTAALVEYLSRETAEFVRLWLGAYDNNITDTRSQCTVKVSDVADLLPGGRDLRLRQDQLIAAAPEDTVAVLTCLAAEHNSRPVVVSCCSLAVEHFHCSSPALHRVMDAAAAASGLHTQAVSSLTSLACWLSRRDGGLSGAYFEQAAESLVSLALAFPAFPLFSANNTLPLDMLLLDEFAQRVAVKCIAELPMSDPNSAREIASLVQAVTEAEDGRSPASLIDLGGSLLALQCPSTTHLIMRYRRQYALYASKRCGDVTHCPYSLDQLRLLLIQSMLAAHGTTMDQLAANRVGMGFFPVDDNGLRRFPCSFRPSENALQVSGVVGCVVSAEGRLEWSVRASVAPVKGPRGASRPFGIRDMCGPVADDTDLMLASVAWDVMPQPPSVSIEPYSRAAPLAPVAVVVGVACDVSKTHVKEVLRRMMRCGFLSLEASASQQRLDGLMESLAEAMVADWRECVSEKDCAEVFGADGWSRCCVVLHEMAAGSPRLIDALQQCDIALKMLLTGAQVSAAFPFETASFDVRSLLPASREASTLSECDDMLEHLRMALDDVHDAAATTRARLAKEQGFCKYKICISVPDTTVTTRTSDTTGEREQFVTCASQRLQHLCVWRDDGVDDPFTVAMTRHFTALALVLPEFRRLVELLKACAIAQRALGSDDQQTPVVSSDTTRRLRISSSTFAALIPASLSVGSTAILCGAVEVVPRTTLIQRIGSAASATYDYAAAAYEYVVDHPKECAWEAVKFAAPLVGGAVGALGGPVGATAGAVAGAGLVAAAEHGYKYYKGEKLPSVIETSGSLAMAALPKPAAWAARAGNAAAVAVNAHDAYTGRSLLDNEPLTPEARARCAVDAGIGVVGIAKGLRQPTQPRAPAPQPAAAPSVPPPSAAVPRPHALPQKQMYFYEQQRHAAKFQTQKDQLKANPTPRRQAHRPQRR